MTRDERDKRIAARYREGLSCREIGAEVGLHTGTVWRVLKRMGVELRPGHPPKGVYPDHLREANERDVEYRRWEKDFLDA